MADDDVPEDLVKLKATFWFLDRRCAWLADRPDADEALKDARVQRSQTVADLYAHPWWTAQPNRYAADQKIAAAARTISSVTTSWVFPSAEFASASGTLTLHGLDPDRSPGRHVPAGISVTGTFTAVGDGTLIALEDADLFADPAVAAKAEPMQEIGFSTEGDCVIVADLDARTATIEQLSIATAKPALGEDGPKIIAWVLNMVLEVPEAGLWAVLYPTC